MFKKEATWKNIKGYNGKYQVSDDGRVRSVTSDGTYHEKSLTLKDCNWQVMLHKNGRYKSHSVHKLMAEAFIPNPEGYCLVYHVNGKADDNSRLSNLAWGNRSDVVRNRVTVKVILQYNPVTGDSRLYNSISEAERKTGVSVSSIQKVLKGFRKTSGGFMWAYHKHNIKAERLFTDYSAENLKKKCKVCGRLQLIHKFKLNITTKHMSYSDDCDDCLLELSSLRKQIYELQQSGAPIDMELYIKHKHIVDGWTSRGVRVSKIMEDMVYAR